MEQNKKYKEQLITLMRKTKTKTKTKAKARLTAYLDGECEVTEPRAPLLLTPRIEREAHLVAVQTDFT
jgi:hypothetical protein